MPSYATFADCERYLESFGTNYYGTSINGTISIDTTSWANDLEAAYDSINVQLSTIERVPIIPVGTSVSTGRFHPHLIEWNAVLAIYRKVYSRHAYEFRGNVPEWVSIFGSRAAQVFEDIAYGKVSLFTDVTWKGIGYPVPVTRVGRGTFYSNWNTGFYQYSANSKTYRFRVIGTTNGNLPGQAEFVVSHDDGYSWETGTRTTGTAWIDIEYGLAVRWENTGTLYGGTQYQINRLDEYQITCVPPSMNAPRSRVEAKTFRRG